METEAPKRPEGDGWRPVTSGDGQIRAWVRGAVPKTNPAAQKTDLPPDMVARTVGGITHREEMPLTTR
jgi:hypothetical protein